MEESAPEGNEVRAGRSRVSQYGERVCAARWGFSGDGRGSVQRCGAVVVERRVVVGQGAEHRGGGAERGVADSQHLVPQPLLSFFN